MKPIFERSYDLGLKSEAVKLAINEPYLFEGNWTCEYSLVWPSSIDVFKVRGVDKLQALTLTLKKISIDFIYYNSHNIEKLTWMGSRKLKLI